MEVIPKSTGEITPNVTGTGQAVIMLPIGQSLT